MKKTSAYLLCVIACMGIMGCSEISDSPQADVASKIIFDVKKEESVTRALEMTANDMTEFAVYGVTSAGGKVATNAIYVLEGSSWNSSQDIYWPDIATDFFAINGSFSDIATKVSFTKSNRRFTYTTPLNADEQLDLMVASAFEMMESTNSGRVSLMFLHPMCTMVIMASNAFTEDWTVKIGRLAVHNVDVTGKITFSKTIDTPNASKVSEAVTIDMQNDIQTIYRDMTENPYELSRTSSVLPCEGDYFFLFKQKLAKWKTKEGAPVSIAEADADGQCYVEIDCKIQDEGGNYIYGSETDWGKVYVPFSAAVNFTDFGQKKNATIKFSGGYDEYGLPLSFGSGLEIEVEDWLDGNENNEPIEVEF